MNPQIKELAIKAQVEHCISHVRLQEFAELIIQDCMDVVDGYTKQRTFETYYDAVEQIENLFGVKHNGAKE